MFHLFWHEISFLIYQESGNREINQKYKDKEQTTEGIDTDQYVLKLTIFLWMQVYSFALKSAKFSRRTNMESSQRGDNHPQKPVILLGAGGSSYSLCQDA